MIKIIGHRGMGATANTPNIKDGVYAENSMQAFTYAMENNSDGVELDVYQAKDGIVVIHGDKLEEYFDNSYGYIFEYTIKELKRINLKHGGKIPTLQEVLALLKDHYKKDILINIEIKGDNIEREVLDIVSNFIDNTSFCMDNFLFNSFDWKKIEKIKDINPEFSIGLNLKSKLIFGKENIVMPGYKVKEGAMVSEKLFNGIQREKNKYSVEYIDCVIGDLREEILNFCSENGIGISTSCPNDRTEFDAIKTQIDMLLKYKDRISNIIFKSDDVRDTIKKIG